MAAVLKSLSTPAKNWTESPESDAVLLECDDPTGTNAVDDNSVEVKVMSPKEVREAADAMLLFLEENRSSSQLLQARFPPHPAYGEAS